MIISTNAAAEKLVFENILSESIMELNMQASAKEFNSKILSGRNLEPFIAKVMNDKAINTSFYGTIITHGGQKFPDIVANKYWGVEVKSTESDHWITIGNSIMEGSRIDDVDRIYLMFGKLSKNKSEFKCRPYEECLSGVAITHSPRYQIDMNLQAGNTIFNKIGVDYDTLRKLDKPFDPIKEYFKKELKPGQEMWYLDKPSNLILRFFSTLSKDEKEKIKITGFALFPEIFGSAPSKYNSFANWLLQEKTIIHPNVRDTFSASGQIPRVVLNGNIYKNVPQKIYKLKNYIPEIFKFIDSLTVKELHNFWSVNNITKANKHNKWIELVAYYSNKTEYKETGNFIHDYLIEDNLGFN